MRSFFLLSFLMLGIHPHHAASQNIGVMLEQVAALYGYDYLCNQDYRTQHHGLQFIIDIQHTYYSSGYIYYTGLSTIHPGLPLLPTLPAFSRLAADMANTIAGTWDQYRLSPWLTPEESNYIHTCYDGLTAGLQQATDRIQELTTDSSLQMTDGERINEIQSVWNHTKRKAMVLSGFILTTDRLIQNRRKTAASLQQLRRLYNIQSSLPGTPSPPSSPPYYQSSPHSGANPIPPVHQPQGPDQQPHH